jgi:ApbE superfamily uncharacterized protein (UPF0280 family)
VVGNGGISRYIISRRKPAKTTHICASAENLGEAVSLGWRHDFGALYARDALMVDGKITLSWEETESEI